MANTYYYFPAASRGAAVESAGSRPEGDEVITSTLAPNGREFQAFVELVTGQPFADVKDSDVNGSEVGDGVYELGLGLVSQLADRDAQELSDLVGPWSDLIAKDAAANDDLADFVTDLQHLCRNAVATQDGVYVLTAS